MNIIEYMRDNIVYLDGGLGTLLLEAGLLPGQPSESWNISQPEAVIKIHRDYFNAGSNIVCANTFGANSLRYKLPELESIISSAMSNVKAAREQSSGSQEKFIALDIGPTGSLLAPFGNLDFEDAVAVFAESVRLGVKYGAELIMIETMTDSYETKAALLAAKENSDLPVFVLNSYGEDGTLMTGASPAAMVALLEGMRADAIGVNCSLGPKALSPVVQEYLKYSSLPVILKPNAGLPEAINGKTRYDVGAEEFAEQAAALVSQGVRIAGGCCGTTPEYISALVRKTKEALPRPITPKAHALVSSYARAVQLGAAPVLIGERINPTGKKRFKKALLENDMDYILGEGLSQQEKGVHILDVNVGLPEIDETETLKRAVCELQAVTSLPLQLDTASPKAMEAALRRYNGKAMINSVNGKPESMEAIFPLVQKYGGLAVALTLDENGIPETARGRLDIARRILKTAASYGIDKKDIIFDTLTMTISAAPDGAQTTLEALRLIRDELGCNTCLGVSNVSFGLPERDRLNSVFFSLALEGGLSAAIMNPHSSEMMGAYHSFRALRGIDGALEDYIAFSSALAPKAPAAHSEGAPSPSEARPALQKAILNGMREQAAGITARLLETMPPLDIVQGEIIPALDLAGRGFEDKTIYLPQLLMSAEAAKAAFELIKTSMLSEAVMKENKISVVIATVKGDIHDIGKNIVKLLLENYGFEVTDLGRDVPPDTILEAAVRLHAPLVGLSALMTTTVPAMEETIRLLKENAPWCRIVVGGAVLTESYAAKIGADKYAGDAMETVRYAEELNARRSCDFQI